MTLGEMIKQYREEHHLSQRVFANQCGLSNVTINAYEKSMINPKTGKPYRISYETYFKLATVMGIDIDEMFTRLGDDAYISMIPSNVKQIRDMKSRKIPLIGRVAAGEPILADESYEMIVDCPGKADYALEVVGESMVPTYLPGDILYIREQQTIDYPGQVAVVLLDDEATVKHVYIKPDSLLLISDNPAYEPMLKKFSDYATVRILGTVCGYTRMYK